MSLKQDQGPPLQPLFFWDAADGQGPWARELKMADRLFYFSALECVCLETPGTGCITQTKVEESTLGVEKTGLE